MFFKKLRLAAVVIFAVMAAPIFGAGSSSAQEQKTVAFIGYSEGVDQPFWIAMGEAVKAAAKKANIDLLDLTPATPDWQEQKRLMEYAIENKKVDGIILGAIRSARMTGAFNKAVRRGIPVVAVDTKVINPAVKAYVATDNLASAQMMGDYLVQATQGRGTLLILGGAQGHPNGDARRDGVMAKAKLAGMRVIFRYADWQIEKGYQITWEELSRPNDIVAVFACNDPVAVAAEDVVKKKGLQGRVIVAGFDGLDIVYQRIASGEIKATIAQPISRMAQTSVQLMADLLAGKAVDGETLIHGILVDKSNVGRFLKP